MVLVLLSSMPGLHRARYDNLPGIEDSPQRPRQAACGSASMFFVEIAG